MAGPTLLETAAGVDRPAAPAGPPISQAAPEMNFAAERQHHSAAAARDMRQTGARESTSVPPPAAAVAAANSPEPIRARPRIGSPELLPPRRERIALTPPPIVREPRGISERPGAEHRGVHIGSLEVHVAAPPALAAAAAPPAVVQLPAPASRAAAPLARGFAAFGLVQS